MYQLRIYTLRTGEALEQYASVHWPRHIPSLRDFGVVTHGIWTQHDGDTHRFFALISYPEGADPGEVANAYIIPDMMANAATDKMTPEEAVAWAEKQIRGIYKKWMA